MARNRSFFLLILSFMSMGFDIVLSIEEGKSPIVRQRRSASVGSQEQGEFSNLERLVQASEPAQSNVIDRSYIQDKLLKKSTNFEVQPLRFKNMVLERVDSLEKKLNIYYNSGSMTQQQIKTNIDEDIQDSLNEVLNTKADADEMGIYAYCVREVISSAKWYKKLLPEHQLSKADFYNIAHAESLNGANDIIGTKRLKIYSKCINDLKANSRGNYGDLISREIREIKKADESKSSFKKLFTFIFLSFSAAYLSIKCKFHPSIMTASIASCGISSYLLWKRCVLECDMNIIKKLDSHRIDEIQDLYEFSHLFKTSKGHQAMNVNVKLV